MAFLLVFLSHAQWAPPSLARVPLLGPALIGLHRHGGLGVDLFLVLSAYLITTLLLIEHDQRGGISLKFFYIRRSLRIWPLYYFILAFMMFAYPLLKGTYSSDAHQAVLQTHGVASVFFLGNLADSFTSVEVPDEIGHLWTISLEEQFYLLWPALLVLFIGRRRVLHALLVGALVGGVLARVWAAVGDLDLVVWKSTLTHFDPLALGSALALYRAQRPGAPRWSTAKLLLGIGLIVLTTEFPRPRDETLHGAWTYLAVAAGFTLMIDASLSGGRGWIGRALGWRPLAWLGQLTYGLYIYHLLGLEVGGLAGDALGASLETRRGWAAHMGVALVITVAMAYASSRLLERPFMRLKRRFAFVASRDT